MHERREVTCLFRRLCGQVAHRFPEARGKLCAPCTHGVYIIRDEAGQVVHVGRTPRGCKGLRQRLYNHLHGLSSFTDKYLKGDGRKLRAGYTFKFLEVPDARKRALLEAYATGWLCPLHLGLAVGKESQDRPLGAQ